MSRAVLPVLLGTVAQSAAAWVPSEQGGVLAPKPIPATALLTRRFDPARATCPNLRVPDRDSPAGQRPPSRVTRHDEKPARRVEAWSALSRDAG